MRARQKRAAERLGEAGALEARLVTTEAGRVLVAGIRAHGGWNAWLALPELTYTRIRILPSGPGATTEAPTEAPTEATTAPRKEPKNEPENEPATEAAKEGGGEAASRQLLEVRTSSELPRLVCTCEGAAHLPHPASAPAAAGALTEELFLLSLPFLLQDPSIVAEYLGVEDDILAGALFERARYTWSAPSGKVQVTAWFDRSTFLLSRALVSPPDGRLSVVVFSQWKDVAGIRLPTRRDFFETTHLYGRWDRASPVARDVVLGLTATSEVKGPRG
jgi:hypothetical protein